MKNQELDDDFCCDISDAFESDPGSVGLRYVPFHSFRHYGNIKKFYGPVETAICPRDNSKVKELFDTLGNGRVLVVDGSMDLECALLGDNVVKQGIKNGWNGIVVVGAVRDCHQISKLPFGVLAMGSHPRRTIKRNLGTIGKPITVLNVNIRQGDWIHVDETGIIVTNRCVYEF